MDFFFMFRHLDLCIFKWQREGHFSLYNSICIVVIRLPDVFSTLEILINSCSFKENGYTIGIRPENPRIQTNKNKNGQNVLIIKKILFCPSIKKEKEKLLTSNNFCLKIYINESFVNLFYELLNIKNNMSKVLVINRRYK